MPVDLQLTNVLGTAAQPVSDANGNASSLTLSRERVGVGTAAPVSKVHIHSGVADIPPRLESAPGSTGAFAAGWDFYPGGIGKGYVGVPDASAGFGAGELLLYGGQGTATSLWAGSSRGLTLDIKGNVGIGITDPKEKLHVVGNIMATGDISLTNADCAEDFDIGDGEPVEPGTVMVLGDAGVLCPSQRAYDKRVAASFPVRATTGPVSCSTSRSRIASGSPLHYWEKSIARWMRATVPSRLAIC